MTTRDFARSKYVDFDRMKRTIDEGPYDAVIVMSPDNVPYFSGFYNMDIRFIPERLHLVVWPRGGEPAFVVIDRRKKTLLPGDTLLTDIVAYEGEGFDSMRAVAEVLADRGVTQGLVGIEGRSFPYGHLRNLQERLPGVAFEDAYSFLESIKTIKTPAEIELLTRLASWTGEAIETAFFAAKPGDSERSIAARMQYELLLRGADMIAFPTFGSGERSGYFHGLASDRPIENGTLIKTDFGGLLEGYYSDLARNAVMGRASPYQRDMYRKMVEIKDHIVASIRPGMLASEVAHIGRDAYKERGVEFKWAIIGHSIGMAIHEEPQIYTWTEQPILAGMTMMIEIGYSDYPNDTFHVEDLILVEEGGARYLNDVSRHKELWEIGV